MTTLFVDVNVPMYAAGAAHRYREACIWVLQQIAAGHIEAVIDTEIIQEVLYRYGNLKRWQIAATMANNLFVLIPNVLAVTLSDAQLAVELFKKYAPQGITARDLIHVAVMQNNDIQHIISTDKHFDKIAGIKRLDPLWLYEQAEDR